MSKDYAKTRACSRLLPPPGGDVVVELLDDIDAQAQQIEELTTAKELAEADNRYLVGANKLSMQERDAALAQLRREKDARVYYQSIVYAVCNRLDALLAQQTICGTLETPSTGVQDGMELVAARLAELERLDAAVQDDKLAARVVAKARNNLTKYPEMDAIRDYRAGLNAAKEAADAAGKGKA